MNINNRYTALVPIKRNSERIPGKNFKRFCGKPLFEYVLNTLNGIPYIDNIIINTDAEELLEELGIYKFTKVKLRRRNAKICGDDVSMNVIISDDLSACSGSNFIMTHTTNPLLTDRTIKRALTLFEESKTHDSLFSVYEKKSRFYDQNGAAINHDPNNLIRTQDLPPLYEENSNLYIFSRESFSNTNARIGRQPQMFPIAITESVDIDDMYGWQIAKAIMESGINIS